MKWLLGVMAQTTDPRKLRRWQAGAAVGLHLRRAPACWDAEVTAAHSACSVHRPSLRDPAERMLRSQKLSFSDDA